MIPAYYFIALVIIVAIGLYCYIQFSPSSTTKKHIEAAPKKPSPLQEHTSFYSAPTTSSVIPAVVACVVVSTMFEDSGFDWD